MLHHLSFNFNTEKDNRSWQQFFNDLADNLPFEDDTYLETIRVQDDALNREAAGLANAAANIRELDLNQMLQIGNPLQLQVYMNVVSGNVTSPVLVTNGGALGKSFLLRMTELGLQRQAPGPGCQACTNRDCFTKHWLTNSLLILCHVPCCFNSKPYSFG